jgi:hypothetical protein
MSKSSLRKDKTCLNCRHVVAERFCPNCGQENTDTRKTFHHLFIHFFEDLTHYENAFWKTIKNLLFKPSALSKEYLSGKRLSYLAPVRLYIFISFVTFLLIALFPNDEEPSDSHSEIKTAVTLQPKKEKDGHENFINMGYRSVKELDSLQKFGTEKDKLDPVGYWVTRKIQYVNDTNTKTEVVHKLTESATHNFPKVLLIYMPLFAFFLWLFHGKKRWYYFDHGIFTLHYFSFLLLIFLLVFLATKLLLLLGTSFIGSSLISIVEIVGYIWMFYYFFPAHHRFYGETRIISLSKSLLLFVINMFFMIIILGLFFLYTLITIT